MTRPAVHPAIRRAFDCWPREETELAAEVIGRAFEAQPADFGHRAWTESLLGRRGFPFELAFSDTSSELRYTLELDRPGRACHRRLSRAAAVAASFDGGGWPHEVIETLERLHHDHRRGLRFGAWLGVRHGRRLGLKLYAELPASSAAWIETLESRCGYRTWGGARPVLLGVEADRLEVYYQALSPMPHELPSLLGRAGFEPAQATKLRGLLEKAYGLPLERGMPAPEVGLSYAFRCDQEAGAAGVEAFTLYHPADVVFGGDGSIRRAWLELLARRGADTQYEAISRPLDRHRGGALHHGMFGIVVPKRGEPGHALGLTPPAFAGRLAGAGQTSLPRHHPHTGGWAATTASSRASTRG